MSQITSILLCFNYLNAYTIEASIIILSCLGISDLYITKILLPWYADSILEGKIFLWSNLFFYVAIICFTISMVFLRCKALINSEYNNLGFYLSIVCIFASLFGLITTLFIYVLLITNMKFFSSEKKNPKNAKDKNSITSQDWVNTVISMILSSLIWIILMLLTMSDNLRIDLKINASYYKYLKALKDAENDIGPKNNVSEVLDGYKNRKKKKLKESTTDKMLENNDQNNPKNIKNIGISENNVDFKNNKQKKIIETGLDMNAVINDAIENKTKKKILGSSRIQLDNK